MPSSIRPIRNQLNGSNDINVVMTSACLWPDKSFAYLSGFHLGLLWYSCVWACVCLYKHMQFLRSFFGSFYGLVVLSCLIGLFFIYLILLLFHRCLDFLSKERRKRCGFCWEKGGGKAWIKIYCRKRIYFQKRGEGRCPVNR